MAPRKAVLQAAEGADVLQSGSTSFSGRVYSGSFPLFVSLPLSLDATFSHPLPRPRASPPLLHSGGKKRKKKKMLAFLRFVWNFHTLSNLGSEHFQEEDEARRPLSAR